MCTTQNSTGTSLPRTDGVCQLGREESLIWKQRQPLVWNLPASWSRSLARRLMSKVRINHSHMTWDTDSLLPLVWDTAGQERFRSVTKAFYHGALGAVVVYDITNRQTFDSVQDWINDCRSFASEGTKRFVLNSFSRYLHHFGRE